MAAIRYSIVSIPIGYTGGSSVGGKIIQSGKLSATPDAKSAVVTVPAAPANTELRLCILPVYDDGHSKSGNGYAWLHIADPGVEPAPGGAEAAVDPVPRFLITPWVPQSRGDQSLTGFSAVDLYVRPGQRFAIQDTGWSL